MNDDPAFVQGGMVTKQYSRMVEEDTPELLILPRGSKVIPLTKINCKPITVGHVEPLRQPSLIRRVVHWLLIEVWRR